MSKDKDEIHYNKIKHAMREVMKTTSGRTLMWEILDLCGLYSQVFTGNSQTFYLEGKRSIGLSILQIMQDTDRKMYPKLLMEKIENASS